MTLPDVSVVVASYGSGKWAQLAQTRAAPSARKIGAREVIVHHEPEGTVASSRNNAAAQASGEWLLVLDADDELDHDFLHGMRRALQAARVASAEEAVLVTPMVSYVRGQAKTPPMFWPECDLRLANWLVVGTMVPKWLFDQAGGFDDNPAWGAFEDWEFFIRCTKAGARVVKAPRAVYVAHATKDSRHRGQPNTVRIGWHRAIGQHHYPELYPPGWNGHRLPRQRVSFRRPA